MNWQYIRDTLIYILSYAWNLTLNFANQIGEKNPIIMVLIWFLGLYHMARGILVSQFPDQELNLCSLHWKHRILTFGLLEVPVLICILLVTSKTVCSLLRNIFSFLLPIFLLGRLAFFFLPIYSSFTSLSLFYFWTTWHLGS